MGSSVSQQKKKLLQVKTQVNQQQEQLEKESFENSPQRIRAQTEQIESYSPSPNRNFQMRSCEKIIMACSSPLYSSKIGGSSSHLQSEVSEQDQVYIQNHHRVPRVSKFFEMKQLADAQCQNSQKEVSITSQKIIFPIQTKDIHTLRSIRQQTGRNTHNRMSCDFNYEDYNMYYSSKDLEGNNQFKEGDIFSKMSMNENQKNKDERVYNLMKHIQHLNKLAQNKQKEKNLFSNEADIFYSKKDEFKEGESSKQKQLNSLIRESMSNSRLFTCLPPINNNQKNLNETAFFTQNQQSNQQISNQQSKEQELKEIQQSELGDQAFKHEVIQVSKKSKKEFFKKGNIYLSVQDENNLFQKNLEQNNSENIIAELITNNISVTDYLVSDRAEIHEQIKQRKNKQKLQIQQISNVNPSSIKSKRKYSSAQGNQTSLSTFSSNSSQAYLETTHTRNSISSFSSALQQQEDKNIIISYSQDWESMRRGAIQQSVK